MSINILLADDHEVVREGLQRLLDAEPDMTVVGTAGDGKTAIGKASELKPDIVVMDISMPDMNGIVATQRITAELPTVKVVCLSIHTETRFVRAIMAAGASGYLGKNCAARELVTAVRTVTEGSTYLSPVIAGDVIKSCFSESGPPQESSYSRLTVREREILQLLAEGKRVKEIATDLNVSINTVHSHRQNLMHKLGLESTADIVKYAIREGLTTP
ncbi:MAG: response regulator transcription factor [Candidatus Pacebacteria bacterium]|nr:response regulator transcription factor [Candidatus Paceibacterota bacterium]